MVLYGIKNEIARCVCRGHTEKRRDGRKATRTGGADNILPSVFSPLLSWNDHFSQGSATQHHQAKRTSCYILRRNREP